MEMFGQFSENEMITVFLSAISIGIAIAAILVTWSYSSKAKKISEDEIFYALYSRFNERYDKINGLIQDLFNNHADISLEELKAMPDHYGAVIDFFNICAEEYYWQKKKRIEKEVWFAWHYGMNYWYKNITVVRELWGEEIAEEKYKSYYLKKNDNLFDRII